MQTRLKGFQKIVDVMNGERGKESACQTDIPHVAAAHVLITLHCFQFLSSSTHVWYTAYDNSLLAIVFCNFMS